jgi:hypothetical protein
MMDIATDMSEISSIIYRYSRAMDARQWALMDQVFVPDVVGELDGFVCRGRDELVRFIRAAIECCATTHHMNVNIEAAFANDRAKVWSKFSAWHTGRNDMSDRIFLALGSYTDDFVRTPHGWRIANRAERTQIQVWLDASQQGSVEQFFAAAFSAGP